jgi:hypothetical protein
MTETLTSPPEARRRLALVAPETRAVLAAVAVLVAVIGAAAAWDPSGLLAPVGGRGLPVLGVGGVYRWAPLVVGFPILLVGTALPVWMAARVGRPAVTASRVFSVAWLGVVGAAALAVTATGVAAVIPLLGNHLSVGQAVHFSAATSGFAAVKYVLVGPLIAAAAALAFRFGPHRTVAETRPTGSTTSGLVISTAVMFVVTSLAAITFAGHWWRGGSLGYAFHGLLVAPTAASDPLGFLAGMAVFLGVFFWAVRTAQKRLAPDARPSDVALTVWLAAIAAGLSLGGVGAAIAALPPSARLDQAGPDNWWISTTLIFVAVGIGYGAAVGVFGAVLTGLVWRFRSVFSIELRSRTQRTVAASVAVLLLAAAPLVGPSSPAGPEPTAPARASGGMERLRLLPPPTGSELPVIGDATGRQVLLRGVNVNQLIDYYQRDPMVPPTQPLTEADFVQMAAMGFNVVRLGMSWSRLEPSRGTFDHGYLQHVKAAVAAAKANGIYTVLDMHEDAWGTSLARPSEQCGGGTTPTTGWDGAPAWATITDGTAHCQFMARDLAPAVATAFGNFYTDRDGIQSELVRTWAFVARSFANEPAVAGYDLLNEPGIGPNPPISSGLLLGRYYDAAITAIRDAEAAAGGYPHLVFFEPSVLWSGLGFDVTPPPGFTDDRQLVFAPHPYSESISMDQSLGLTIASIERNLTASSRAAASYGAALWTGEWGWFGDPSVDGAKVERFIAAQNRLGIGGAFWVWRQGCGSPETGPDADTSGNLVAVDCATGELLAPPAGFARPLTSAYPRAFPGRLDTLTSDLDRRGLTFVATVETDGTNCTLDVWVPGDGPPHLVTTGVDNAATTKVPGGWKITGYARGRYTVSVTS